MEAKAGISTVVNNKSFSINAVVEYYTEGYTSQARKENIEKILYRAIDDASSKIEKYLVETDLGCALERDKKIAELKSLFNNPIYVKIIDNEYWGEHPYAWASPWLLVTTAKGVIKIGWRKRVINIDWSQSDVKTEARDLFPTEDVTKGDYTNPRYIHAWGYEKAKEYLDKILS